MSTAPLLALALLLDARFGEPAWLWNRLPHPAVVMGRGIDWLDKTLNKGDIKRAKGVAALAALTLGAGLLGAVISALPLGWLWSIVLTAILVAQKSLVQHVHAVAVALRKSLAAGRAEVAMIVGRDTADMTEAEVARAAIESAAENLSDGVIAPAFWFLIAGLPGILVYKVINTADSMIGHRTERHAEFGWASARMDDLLNLLPARLTAIMILLVQKKLGALPEVAKDATLHRSPNAGWPEAAMAICLDVALSGPRSYHGEQRTFPFVHAEGRRDLGALEIEGAMHLLWKTWGLFTTGIALAAAVFYASRL